MDISCVCILKGHRLIGLSNSLTGTFSLRTSLVTHTLLLVV